MEFGNRNDDEAQDAVLGKSLGSVLKVADVSNSVTYLNQTPIFECGCELVWFQEQIPRGDMVKQKIGRCVQNMITILSSIMNIFDWDICSYLMSTMIFILIKNMIFQ